MKLGKSWDTGTGEEKPDSTLEQESVSILGSSMQSADSSDLDEPVNNAVQQWVAQINQEVGMGVGSLQSSVDVSPHHLENLHFQNTRQLFTEAPQTKETQQLPQQGLTPDQELIPYTSPKEPKSNSSQHRRPNSKRPSF